MAIQPSYETSPPSVGPTASDVLYPNAGTEASAGRLIGGQGVVTQGQQLANSEYDDMPRTALASSTGLGVHPSSPESPGAPRCRGMRVLLVDDDPSTVEALCTLLELEGARVSPATNVTDALQRLHADQPDVVVTDIGMPGGDGFALIHQIRAIPGQRRLPMIALTGLGRKHDVQRIQEAGFYAHIGKPVVFEDLLQKMRQAVQVASANSSPGAR